MRREPQTTERSTSGRRPVVAVAVAALLIGSCVGFAATSAIAASSTTSSTLTDLDENTPLTERSSWESFKSDGRVSVNVTAPDLTLTIGKEQENVDLRGFHNDYSNEYLRIQYDEDLSRTIRFYVPSNYWGSYFDERVESVGGDDAAIKLVPVLDGRYTAVTIDLTGKTDAVFKISQTKGKTWSFWSAQDEKIENVTGVSSGISGTEQWNYAQADEWSDDGTLTIENVSNPDRVLIQYDAGTGEEAVWLRVTGEQDRDGPYYFVRESSSDGNATIVVVSESSTPAPVRVQRHATARDGIGSVVNDWAQTLDRASSFFDGLFGSRNNDD
jgi:hypothetical protein